jgi:hypothetical protein
MAVSSAGPAAPDTGNKKRPAAGVATGPKFLPERQAWGIGNLPLLEVPPGVRHLLFLLFRVLLGSVFLSGAAVATAAEAGQKSRYQKRGK